MPEKFSFDTAFMHFQHTKGPPGFIWKFLLTYSVIMTVISAVVFVPFLIAWFSFMSEVVTSGDPDPDMTLAQMGGILIPLVIGMPIFLIVYFVLFCMFESAALRRYIRGDGFSLKLGADEFRIMGVQIVWFLLFLAAYLLCFIIIGAALAPALMSSNSNEVPAFIFLVPLLAIPLGLAMIFFSVRLAPASAITIRDQKLKFWSAWPTTKGRFWPMVGAYLVIYLIVCAIQMAGQFASMIPMVGAMVNIASAPDPESPEAIMAMFTSPFLLIGFLVMMVAQVISMAFMHFANLGITSKAVLTDPAWVNPDTAATFD